MCMTPLQSSSPSPPPLSGQSLGWANEVVAGVEEDGHGQNTACSLFSITMTLTEAGLAAGQGLGLGPVALAFQYLDLLTREGEWKGG